MAGDELESPVSGHSDYLGFSLTASRYNVEVKHIKIMTAEGLYRITEKKAFRGLTVSTNLPQSWPIRIWENLALPEAPSWDRPFPYSEQPLQEHHGATYWP